MTTETPELALEELARRIDADGTASQIGSADEVREIAAMVARRSAASAEPAVVVAQWQRYANLIERKWINIEPDEIDEWKRLGYPIRALYAAPPYPVVSEAMVQALQVAIHTLTAIRELCDKNRIDAMLNKVSAAGVDVAIIRARAALGGQHG